MHTVGRHALRVPDGTDGPPNVPLWMDRLAVDLSDVAKDNQGTFSGRPESTTLAPGVAGRYFATTDELDAGAARRRLYRDAGTAWDELATLPVSRRMLSAELAAEHPAGLLSPAEFLALGAQPDGTVARVRVDVANGINWRFRFNAADSPPHRWEFDGGAALYNEVATDEITASGTYVALTTPGPSLTLPLAGHYRVRIGATMRHQVVGAYTSMSYAIGATAATDADAAQMHGAYTNAYVPGVRLRTKLDIPAGTVLAARYRTSGANAGYLGRWMEVTPMRVTGP